MGAINNLLSVQDRFLQPSDLHKNLGVSSLCNFGIADKGLRALYEDVGVQNDATGKKGMPWLPQYCRGRRVTLYCKSGSGVKPLYTRTCPWKKDGKTDSRHTVLCDYRWWCFCLFADGRFQRFLLYLEP